VGRKISQIGGIATAVTASYAQIVVTANLDIAQAHRTGGAMSLRILVPAFMISELLFLPFLIIDLVVASVSMSMGMMMLPPVVVSLPFKLIFFVLVDGWSLVAGSLVQSYGG
jgi:flagellar biosynthesis protein FliP